MKLSGINMKSIDEQLEIESMKDEFDNLYATEEFFSDEERDLYEGLLRGQNGEDDYVIQDEYINGYLN